MGHPSRFGLPGHGFYSFFGFAARERHNIGHFGDSSTPSEMLQILSNGRVYGQINSVCHSSFRLESYVPGALSQLLAFMGISIYNCG
jgi:hypothetical protein